MGLVCIWHALLLATASSSKLVDVNGRAALQHGAASPASLPLDILVSAVRGELPKVVKWLREGGAIDALCPVPMEGGQTATTSLLHAAARRGQLEMVRELLKRGASVDLPSSLGFTALMEAAAYVHLPIVLFLLQHSANPDLQTNEGVTALMLGAAGEGHEACVTALLRAGANTELLDNYGRAALQWAETKGHTATATLLRQHASCLSLGRGAALCAAPPPTWSWVALSVLLGAAVGVVASRPRTLTAAAEQDRAAARAAAEQAAQEQAAQEQAAVEQAEEDRLIDEAMERSIAWLQADEERRRTITASTADAPAATPPTSRSPGPANGEPSRAGPGGRGGSGVPRVGRGGRHGSGVGGDGGAAGPSSQAVLALADAGDITGRPPVPESTIGGETTCIVCMAHPKSHIAVPCGHLCVCGGCAGRMQDCPYCRTPVQQWIHARVV